MSDPPQEPTAEAPAGQAQPASGDSRPAELHGCPVVTHLGAVTVHCDRGRYRELAEALKADGYAMPVGVTAVDYLTHPGRDLPAEVEAQRFEVVVELASLRDRARVRIRCQIPGDDPWAPSLFEVWPGTEAHERETYDMYGIRFEGHPDLSRILMPEDWEGHPLRKDYATGHVPVQFKESPGGR